MRLLFVLTELPFPAHRNGVALINYELITRAPAGTVIDLLVAEHPQPETEAKFRQVANCLGKVIYVGPATARRYRIGNLLSGALLGRCIFEAPAASAFVEKHQGDYHAVYIAPLMSYVDPGRFDCCFMNAVDSFDRLNRNAFEHSGRRVDRIKSWLYGFYERKILRRVALTSFVSSADLAYVKQQGGDFNAVCNPNGVDTDYFVASESTREPYSILFTGNLSYAPNSEAALHFAHEILPLVRQVQPDAVFYVVGRNPPAELATIPGVVVTGFVDDIRSYYRQCSVFVCPLLSGAGIKNKMLEAMACGIPIVTSRLGVEGIEDIVPGEHYLPAELPQEFADQIRVLWSASQRGEAIAGAARRAVASRMSWSLVAERYFANLADVVSATRSAQK